MQSSILFTIIYISSIAKAVKFSPNQMSSQIPTNRTKRFWPVGVVRFENGPCNGTNYLDGTCYTRRQCRNVEGVVAGRCAQNIAVCCVVQYTCGDISSLNNTYFVSPNFPNPFSGGTRCSMTIKQCNSDICQVRIDFLTLNLAQPNADGVCVNDALRITNGGSLVPTLCGENSGQHVYVDFNGNENIQMAIDTSSEVALGRNWNFKVTQIGCGCPTRAPTGCLMYYTGRSGTVQSFNYGSTASTEVTSTGTIGTRQLVNQNYGVCVAMLPGYCGIRWSQTSRDSFTLSGDTVANSEILGTSDASETGSLCNSDYVIIPHPYINGRALNYDRFCGNGFPTVVSYSKPFVLTVVTNGNETQDVTNRGFSLDFTQERCTTTNTML